MIKQYVKTFESYNPILNNNVEDIINFIESECSDFLNSKNTTNLYRGLSPSFKDKIYIADSTDYERKSPEFSCHNYIIDNDKQWRDYPKRSKSIICTNIPYITESYGKPFFLIPANFSKIAVAPEPDVWESFTNRFGEPFDTSEFWQSFCIVLWKALKQKKEEKKKILDYNSLLEACKLYDENKTNIFKFVNKNTLDIDEALKELLLQEFFKDDNTKTMYELLSENIFKPDGVLQGFKLYKSYGEFCSNVKNNKFHSGHEIWYEGKALMISLSDKILERYITNDKKIRSGREIFDFIKNYFRSEG
jgi:hypothetical protein